MRTGVGWDLREPLRLRLFHPQQLTQSCFSCSVLMRPRTDANGARSKSRGLLRYESIPGPSGAKEKTPMHASEPMGRPSTQHPSM